MDFDLAYAQWTLRLFPREELPALAGEAMVQGFDGPAILNLVSYAAPTLHQLTDQEVEAAFRELGPALLTDGEAALVVARHYGRQLLRGQVTPEYFAKLVLEGIRRAEYVVPDPLYRFSLEMDMEEPDQRRLSELSIKLARALIA